MPVLVLGTAQFGQVYGVTNPTSAVAEAEVFQILRDAAQSGVSIVDTAIEYGDSQRLLGKAIGDKVLKNPRIITKIKFPPQKDLKTWAVSQIETALGQLNVSRIDGLLLHQPADFNRKEAWEALSGLKERGLVERIGASIYVPEDLLSCPDAERIELLQIPMNILDDRWDSGDWRSVLNQASPPEIHVRSVFLQGLLLAEPSRWPASLQPSAALVNSFIRQASESVDGSVLSLCIRFVRSIGWVDGLVVGVYSHEQLKEVVAAFESPLFEEKTVGSNPGT